MKDFVTFELAKKLKENGFDERCEYTFYNNYRVRDEIYEKHPGLSDDGYEDLRKKYGGPYKDEEVYGYYIEPLKLYSRNSTIGVNPITKQKVSTNALCSCPNVYQVLEWLRGEKNIYISIFIADDSKCPVTYEIYKGTECMHTHHGEYFSLNDWSKCELRAIEYVIDNLIS